MPTGEQAKSTSDGADLRPTIIAVVVILLACGVVLAVAAWARLHAESSVFDGSRKVEVTMTSYAIDVPHRLTAGKVGFDVHNNAAIAHEFVVFRTDLPANKLPVGSDGDVIEDSPQLHSVADSGSSLKPGASRAVLAQLTPGHYVAVCNLPDHYRLGMYADFVVTASKSS